MSNSQVLDNKKWLCKIWWFNVIIHFNFHNTNHLCLLCKKSGTEAESWKVLKRTDRGEMTVHHCSEQLKKYMVSLGKGQSCNENAYIIHYTRLWSFLALCKTLKRVDIKSLSWLKLIECFLNCHFALWHPQVWIDADQNLLFSGIIQDTYHLLTFSEWWAVYGSISQETNTLLHPQANVNYYLDMFLESLQMN